MKIITVLGSPNKNGNTAKALGWLEDDIMSRGHNIERVNIVDLNLSGCLGCGTCNKNPDEPGCVQEDDGNGLFEKMIAADAVVYSCGLYMWSFTSQLKTLLDRTCCLVTGFGSPTYKSLIDGKKSALLMTCAGPEENNAELVKTTFQRWSWYARTKTENLITILPGCTVPEELGESAKEKCKALAATIVS